MFKFSSFHVSRCCCCCCGDDVHLHLQRIKQSDEPQIHYERTTFREQFQCLFILFFFLWNAEFCRWASNWISRRVELWILPWSCAQSRRRQLRNGCSSSLNLRLFFLLLLLLLVFVRWHVIYTELRFPITSHHFLLLLLLLLSRLYITLYMKIRLWFVASQVFWSFFF